MNFVAHLTDIQNKLFRRDRFGGCYVYSREMGDVTFKLGMSENLFARVKQAKSCYPYPSEFWLHMLMICHRKADIRPLEKKLLTNKQLIKTVEDEEPEVCECKTSKCECKPKTKKEQGNRPREYRIATSRTILNTAVYHTLNDNRKLWDMVVVFGHDGWVLIANDEPIKSISMLGPSTSKELNPIEKGEPIAVGDSVFVIYKDKKDGPPKVSTAGKVTRELKFYWEIRWDDWNGEPFVDKYKRYEVYKNKKEAQYAKKYWYEDLV